VSGQGENYREAREAMLAELEAGEELVRIMYL